MHVVLVQVTIRPEMLDEFERAVLENARQSVATDPGCLRFDVSQGKHDSLTWVLHEVYDGEHAHAAHRLAPHFLAYQAVADRAILEKAVLWCTGRHIT
jgi:quinol monooxygenase YgiN